MLINSTTHSNYIIDNTFPNEILYQIFEDLKLTDVNAVRFVSKHWHEAMLATVLKIQSHKLNNLISKYNLKETISATSFIEIKSSLLPFRDTLVNVLVKLSYEELDHLDKDSRANEHPIFFQDIFRLAETIKRIEDENTSKDLSHYMRFLITKKRFDMSIAFAKSFKNNSDKQAVFADICNFLNGDGQHERAIHIELNEMDDTSTHKHLAIYYTVQSLTEAGKLEQAKAHVDYLTEGADKTKCLNNISIMKLINDEKFEEAAKLAKINQREGYIATISFRLFNIGRWDDSISILDYMTSSSTRQIHLDSLLKLMKEKNYADGITKIETLLENEKDPEMDEMLSMIKNRYPRNAKS